MKSISKLSEELDTKVEKMKHPSAMDAIIQEIVINPDFVEAFNKRDRLEMGDVLAAGEELVSKNGRFLFRLQKDGNLVLRQVGDGRVLWAAGTEGMGGARLNMQKDANLVLYTAAGKPVWRTATQGKSTFNDTLALLQDDGNFVLYDRVTLATSKPGELAQGTKVVMTPLWDAGVAGRALAEQEMAALYQKMGGPFGSLGPALSGVLKAPDGAYVRNFELGQMKTLAGEMPQIDTYFSVRPRIAAIKSFGSDDPSGEDEIYAVVSLIRIDPGFAGADDLVKTTVIPPRPLKKGRYSPNQPRWERPDRRARA